MSYLGEKCRPSYKPNWCNGLSVELLRNRYDPVFVLFSFSLWKARHIFFVSVHVFVACPTTVRLVLSFTLRCRFHELVCGWHRSRVSFQSGKNSPDRRWFLVEDIWRNARRSGNDSGLCLGRPAYQNGYVELERQKKTFASRLLFYVFHPPFCPPMLTVNVNLIKEQRFVTNFSVSLSRNTIKQTQPSFGLPTNNSLHGVNC